MKDINQICEELTEIILRLKKLDKVKHYDSNTLSYISNNLENRMEHISRYNIHYNLKINREDLALILLKSYVTIVDNIAYNYGLNSFLKSLKSLKKSISEQKLEQEKLLFLQFTRDPNKVKQNEPKPLMQSETAFGLEL
ncbi:hypothetical protein L3V79_08935 [Thiotrichales bacterium 19S9-12]|nr:hypothetical protein [Thiotrichales bacterium 19S9-11]MCF6812481.1 hypothetical protein [Thiotrichales bacterium 19S9-12]